MTKRGYSRHCIIPTKEICVNCSMNKSKAGLGREPRDGFSRSGKLCISDFIDQCELIARKHKLQIEEPEMVIQAPTLLLIDKNYDRFFASNETTFDMLLWFAQHERYKIEIDNETKIVYKYVQGKFIGSDEYFCEITSESC